MPGTGAALGALVIGLVVERLRTVLAAMAFTPAEVTMPRICPAACVLVQLVLATTPRNSHWQLKSALLPAGLRFRLHAVETLSDSSDRRGDDERLVGAIAGDDGEAGVGPGTGG